MKQFRTVKRKANVGERILITNKDPQESHYENGDVLSVKGVGMFGVYYRNRISGFVLNEEYEVIVEEVNPKEENEMKNVRNAKQKLTDYSYEELLDAIKAKAQAEVKPSQELLARVNSHRTFQQQRDEIIEQAKRDVADLSATEIYSTVPALSGGRMSFYPIGCSKDYEATDEIQFIVNNEKRTVVALIKWLGTSDVWAKGIAKCAPTDCFNSAIGKAISLRRALGLEVPSEYLNVPQPTEVRVGDVVKSISKLDKYYTVTEDRYRRNDNNECALTSIVAKNGRIVDDSREGE